jgi:ADP-dependent NAD(P)H-hydrate dehydratase
MLELTDALLRERFALPPVSDGGKDARGRVAVVGGDVDVPGAPLLTAAAALRSGCGKVQIAAPRQTAAGAVAMPEAMIVGFSRAPELLDQCDAAVVGPGTFPDKPVARRCARLLRRYAGRAVVDAGALGVLRDETVLRRDSISFVITPHAGEMATIERTDRETIEKDAANWAQRAAERFGVVAVLKGAVTYVAYPSGDAYRHQGGVRGLATAGSGDVLAGIIGALLARGLSPLAAALWGVRAHARAGEALEERIGTGFFAREICDELPRIFTGEQRLAGG